MKKEIRQINKEGTIVQVTIADERWYLQYEKDKNGEIVGPIKEYPSVTWITSFYPKGIGYMQWLAKHGWDEAEALKEAAGDSGYKVHTLITNLLTQDKETHEYGRVAIDGKVINRDTGFEEEIKLAEYEGVMAFVDWFNAVKPKVLFNEVVVLSDEHQYAGTADFICEIKGETWLIDFKTGQNIWPSYEIQLAAYKKALPVKIDRMAILQLGYWRNKNRYKLTEVEDQFDLFLAARRIWEKEASKTRVFKKDYPTELKLNI